MAVVYPQKSREENSEYYTNRGGFMEGIRRKKLPLQGSPTRTEISKKYNYFNEPLLMIIQTQVLNCPDSHQLIFKLFILHNGFIFHSGFISINGIYRVI